nr:hypothetical protein [Noviherbaspirillum sedimenti]
MTVKRVIDYNMNTYAKADDSGVDLAKVTMSMNELDDIALREAV